MTVKTSRLVRVLALAAFAAFPPIVPAQSRVWKDPYADMATIYGEAMTRMQEGGIPATLSWLEAEAKKDPENLPVIELLGTLWFAMPEDRPGFRKSLPWLRRAERMHSTNAYVYGFLQRVASVRGDAEEADRCFLVALSCLYDDFEAMATEPDLASFRKGALWTRSSRKIGEFRRLRGRYGDLIAGDGALDASEQAAGALQGKFRAIFGTDELFEATVAEYLATCMAARGDSDGALELDRKVVRIRERFLGAGHPRVADSYDACGKALLSLGRLDEAETAFRKALAIREKARGPGSPDVARSMASLARLALERGDWSGAQEAYKRALAAFEASRGPGSLDAAECLEGLAQAASRLGDRMAAIAYRERALAIMRENAGKNDIGLASALSGLGYDLLEIGDYPGAVDRLVEALRAYERQGRFGAAGADLCHSGLGLAYSRMGDFTREIDHFKRSLEIRLELYGENSLQVGQIIGSLAMAYKSSGDHRQSLDQYRQALAIHERLEPRDPEEITSALEGIAQAYGHLGDPAASMSWYERAIAVREAELATDRASIATDWLSLALAKVNSGDADGASLAIKTAFAIFEGLLGTDSPETADICIQISTILSLAGDYAQSLAFAERAAAIYEATPGSAPPQIGYSRMAVGIVRLASGDEKGAEADFARAYAAYRDARAYQDWADAARVVGLSWLEYGRPARAAAAFSEAIAASENARSGLASGKTDFTARNITVYQLAFETARRLGDVESAFGYAEGMRARGFLDQLALAKALQAPGVAPGQREALAAMATRIEELDAAIRAETGLAPKERKPGSLPKLLEERHDAERAFGAADKALASAAPRYAALRNPRTATLADARTLAGKGRVLLEYVIWDERDSEPLVEAQRRCACIVVRQDGEIIVELPRDFDYRGSIAAFRSSITEEMPDWKTKGATLYAALIRPVEPHLQGMEGIVIVPDGPLAFLPFDALTDSATGTPLGTRYRVTLSPSVSVSLMAHGAAGADDERLLAVGGAVYSTSGASASRSPVLVTQAPGATSGAGADFLAQVAAKGDAAYFAQARLRWCDLPGTRIEVGRIAGEALAGRGVRALTGTDASERTIKSLSASGELGKFGLVHLAVHGYWDGRLPEMSAIVLSEVSGTVDGSPEDGYLTVGEAALLRLDAGMVMLSACETGLGSERRGDGLVGLTRAFMIAGARKVGVTLWTVYDESTAEFMVRAYSLVAREGIGFPEAFRRVRLEFMADKRFRAPVHWAAFTVYE
ncbi:MAG: CHAT domain-containing protein [Spirochaetes bacterium]|nr:CHAT domain-containing protein [Spirochaetota bacterium]